MPLAPTLGHVGLKTTHVSEATQKSYIALATNQKTISTPPAPTTLFSVCNTRDGSGGEHIWSKSQLHCLLVMGQLLDPWNKNGHVCEPMHGEHARI